MAISTRSGLTAPEGALEPRPNIDMTVVCGMNGVNCERHVQAKSDPLARE